MSAQIAASPSAIYSRAWTLRVAVGLLAVLLTVLALHESLIELVRRWSRQEEYSHGFLVPVIAVWLLWSRRNEFLANCNRPAWAGAGLMVVAILVHVVGQLSAIFVFSHLAFVIALLAIILAVGGASLFKVAFIPVAFLVFAIPLPYFIDASLSLELQLISSRVGVAFIELFQIPVYLEGNIIDLGSYKLQVVDACSGLRYLFPLFSLSFLTAYLFRAPLWQRALVLFSSIPITIAMNGFRIGLVGLTVDRWGPGMAEGVLHFFEGWIIFVACGSVLSIEVYLLARLSGSCFSEAFGLATPPAVLHMPKGRDNETSQGSNKPLYACLVLVFALLSAGLLLPSRIEVVPERTRFVTFPMNIGEWQGKPSSIEPGVEQSLGVEDYILADYSNSIGKVIDLYVAYYDSQRTGESPHSPLVCIPGGGWSIIKFERTNYGAYPINRAVIERNSSRQLVYYWYVERGRRVANEYWSKLYLLRDAIMMNRSDGALVRILAPIQEGEREEDADGTLQSFLHDLGATLDPFVASGATQLGAAATKASQNRIR